MAANLNRMTFSFSTLGRLLRGRTQEFIIPPSSSVFQSREFHYSGIAFGGRLKSVWRRKRAPALTRLCPEKPEKFKARKAFGGGEKVKVTRAKAGSYIWKSQDIEFETPILDVLYNTAHKHFNERKIMVQGTVIEVDGEPFKAWYENKSCGVEKSTNAMWVDDKILQQLQDGKVLAKVSSRPGQEGKVNGYLLEGQELDDYLEQIRDF
ncbi:40S ribosomal protein S8-like isoform X2 [Dendronephthya gigantea]|uniref:40S ribosomal protein S8-like isoform X2 n=1 Tax=Dendronephthya gigantea TaxID=151771 RepID=UPI00106CE74F|nr:40S ribosomal protein S8-like isoform X2 [Dendronephthya gigantea]